jgi:hypothetical protein
MTMKKVIIATVFFCASQIAFAQSTPYFGIEGGYALVDINASDTAQAVANATGSTTKVTYDRGALSGRVFAGSGINDSIALEIGAFATMSVDAKYSNATGSASEAFSLKGLDFSAKFTHASNWFARGGIHYSQVSGDAQVNMAGLNVTSTGSQSGAGFLAGAGFSDKRADGSITYYEYRYLNKLGGLDNVNTHMFVIGYQK